MTLTLYPHQETAVNYHLLHQWSLNGSEMGVGKTLIALETARRAGKRPAIFGPRFLEGTWRGECQKLGISDYKYIAYSMIHKVKAKDLADYGIFIADECHALKNPKAMRTKAFYKLIKDLLPPYFIGLSGTVLKNKVPDLWVPLAICSQCPTNSNGKRLEGDLQNYFKFSRHFCNVEILKIRGARIEKFTGVQQHKIPELKALLHDKYIRFKISDVIENLPSMIRKEIPLQLKPVPGLEEAFKNYMAGSKVDPSAKSISALLKAKSTAEYVIDILESGESVLIFSDHIAPVQTIRDVLKDYNVACITGVTPADQRHLFVEGFQAKRYHAIVATIGALSTGVTLTAARHVVFNDVAWSHSDNAQALARVYRVGQTRGCFAHYMLGSETDVHIARTVLQKEETAMRIVG